ncbi:MAG: NTP transferase domain-containing protein [Candidatus Latescibacteria bacterium]|nr:NTP transferase domain-containing protein [Candidatus Latescibacterota bacterium]
MNAATTHPTGLVSLIMAAGKGTRMSSDLAKVLHPLCGRPMVEYVVEEARAISSDRILVVIGHQAERLRLVLRGYPVEFVEQREQLGTGHAVLQARETLAGFDGVLLVLSGDTPLLRAPTLRCLVEHHGRTRAAVTILTARMPDPFGLGRIVRDETGQVIRIVEEKDATPEERQIAEVNTGTYCFDCRALFAVLTGLKPTNRQGEYYLTDTIHLLHGQGRGVSAYTAERADETVGINTPEQLAQAERLMQERTGRSG